ncbi:MAG: SMC-Scp complex subunit ScpB [Acidiferrobacterales bacterium]|nr:SMC-Scp complex subunit ScpB [Acidiferrobacterales bacterium]
MSGQNDTVKNVLEAALLVAGQVLSMKKLTSLFPEDMRPSADEINKALQELQGDYEGRGIELVQVGKGYRFQSRQEYAEWVGRLSEERPARYSRALLETLAIVAYRQPVTRGDIEEIRGVSVSSDIVQKLSEREWIREVGHRDVPGRPALFGTTPAFLEHFGLKSLSELPPLSELRDLEEIGRELNFTLDLGDGDDEEAENEVAAESTGAAAGDEDETVKMRASAPGADE